MAKQRALIAAGDWVAEGRDIGTVVAPDAAVKVFLTADAGERARRRAAELGAAPDMVLAEQTLRDERDSTRAHSPLRAGRGRCRRSTPPGWTSRRSSPASPRSCTAPSRGHPRRRVREPSAGPLRQGARPQSYWLGEGRRRRISKRGQVLADQPPHGHARGGRARAPGRHARPQGARLRVERAQLQADRHRRRGLRGPRTRSPARSATRRGRGWPTRRSRCSSWTPAPGCARAIRRWPTCCAARRCRRSSRRTSATA